MVCVEVGDDNVPFLQLGKHQLRLDLEELDEEYQERARTELRETEENVQSSLKDFRDYIFDEPGLNIPVDNDQFLIKFLRPFKFYPSSAFVVLRRYYRFKAKYPKYGMNLTPNNVRHVFDNEVFSFLPIRTSTGSRILLMSIAKWQPKFVTLQDIFKAIMVSIEIAMMEPKTQVAGVQVILDMEGLSLTHIYQFSPTIAKLIVDWVQDCAPVRLKGIHIINQPLIFNMVFAIFKPFLGEKLKKRILFHGSNRKSLCEHVSAESLPKSMGGTGEVLQYPGRLLSEMLFYYEETFELYNTYRYTKEISSKD